MSFTFYTSNHVSPVPADLTKLSNVVYNHSVEKLGYDKLLKKSNAIDNGRFVSN